MDMDAGYAITSQKIMHIQERHIQAISVVCPSCFEQFDMGQIALSRKTKDLPKIPTFYLTQLIGLSLGMTPKQVGLDVHRVKSRKLLESINISG